MSSVCYTYPDLDELVVSYLECGLYNTNYIYLNPEVMILLACLLAGKFVPFHTVYI